MNVHSTLNSTPHVFAIAASAYDSIISGLGSQSVLISGESGAGKTESAKKVLAYLTEISAPPSGSIADKKSISDQIMDSNPLLEAFGNAKTLRNNNSSRFGKWMEVIFDSTNTICGCRIVNYLLEKARVVQQADKEVRFHQLPRAHS